MKHRNGLIAAALISIALIAAPLFGVGARSGIGGNENVDAASSLNGQSRRDWMNLQLKRRAEDRLHPSAKADGRAWLLEPRLFNLLSPAGQTAVMIDNGLLPIPQAKPTQKNRGHRSITTQSAAPGQNIRVNDPLADITGRTHSETSIATNGFSIDETYNSSSDGFGSGYSVSMDGGSSFVTNQIPTQTGGFNIGDPVLSVGPAGEYYHSQIAQAGLDGQTTGESIVEVSKSTDGGLTFSSPVDAATVVANVIDQQDKPWNTTDRWPSSPFKGNVYVSWTDFSAFTGISIQLARSTDGGASFEAPVEISPQGRTAAVQGSMPAVAPNGNLFVAYIDLASQPLPTIKVAQSTDGGVHFSAPQIAAALNSVGEMTGADGVHANSFPAIAI
ncbi:MAG TPA: sialidase family protein, partial [Blastocatellia bacterium]|nr:sialidase family protein [Blastocatellia bacterium]